MINTFEGLPQGRMVKLTGFSRHTYIRQYDEWDPGEKIEGVIVELDGQQYFFYIDPDDGFRSYGGWYKVDNQKLDVTFPPQTVWAFVDHVQMWDMWNDEPADDFNHYFKLINPADGTDILKIGTSYEYGDPYYPCGICHWEPENLPINKANQIEFNQLKN